MMSISKHIDDLPSENLGQILRCGLSVIDRLHCARVSRHWNWAVGEFAWTEQRALDFNSVFEGATPLQIKRFRVRNLITLIQCVGPTLIELDLTPFEAMITMNPFRYWFYLSLQHCPRLEKLNVDGKFGKFKLYDFVAFLPSTLRQLNSGYGIGVNLQALETLSRRCPNLEEVPFRSCTSVTCDIAGEFIVFFPRQKKLCLHVDGLAPFSFEEPKPGALASIGQLQELEEFWFLNIHSGGLDEESLEAIAEGCQRLRLIHLNFILPEKSLFLLAKMENLTTIYIAKGEEFTDSVLKAIAQRGKLKRLDLSESPITDESIVCLVDRCKSLVWLALQGCGKVTERSVEAVVAEVRRRHGWPPRTLRRPRNLLF